MRAIWNDSPLAHHTGNATPHLYVYAAEKTLSLIHIQLEKTAEQVRPVPTERFATMN